MIDPIAVDTDVTQDPKTPSELEQEQLQHLGGHVMFVWRQAALARRQNGMDEEMMECLRNEKGEYSAEEREKISALRQPLVFVRNAARKKQDCTTLIGSVFLNSSDNPWLLRPTPVPEVSEEDAKRIADKTISDYVENQTMELAEQGVPVEAIDAMVEENPPDPMVVKEYARSRRDEYDNKRMEEATRKVERMSKKIRDQLLEGKWREAMTSLVSNCSTFGTCVLKGPIRRSRMRGHFVGGDYKRSATEIYEWESISPMDCYPSKGAINMNDGDFCQRVRFMPTDLNKMRKLGAENGYFTDKINAILERFPRGGLVLFEPIDAERKRLENDGTINNYQNTQIEGIEFWGDVRGQMLIEMGITKGTDGKELDNDDYYEVNAVVIGNDVIFCSLTDERFGRNLFKGVFYKIDGSWWGESPLKRMRDPARAYNATYRAKCVNIASSSGPQIFYDVTKFLAGNNFQMVPYGVYGFKSSPGDSGIPVKVMQTQSNILEFNEDLRENAKLIDSCTGIPSASHVNDASATAGRTYNGLLLIVSAAKEGANTVVYSLYLDVMKPCLDYLYAMNMTFVDDSDIKGDCEVEAGGLLAILVKEQSLNRLTEFLTLAQQPSVQQVIGQSGMAELLREYAKMLSGINSDNVVPTKAEMEKRERAAQIEQRMAQAAQQAQAAPMPNQMPSQQANPQPPMRTERRPMEVEL